MLWTQKHKQTWIQVVRDKIIVNLDFQLKQEKFPTWQDQKEHGETFLSLKPPKKNKKKKKNLTFPNAGIDLCRFPKLIKQQIM